MWDNKTSAYYKKRKRLRFIIIIASDKILSKTRIVFISLCWMQSEEQLADEFSNNTWLMTVSCIQMHDQSPSQRRTDDQNINEQAIPVNTMTNV